MNDAVSPVKPANPSKHSSSSGLAIALAGALSLAAAMGIGRFAFTPLMPMMLAEGRLDLHFASSLATSNYLGYLAGALLCMVLPRLLQRLGLGMPDSAKLVRFSLIATGILTIAMVLDWPTFWAVVRFLAGMISGVAFVYTSGWCLARLAERDAMRLSGLVFTGPGIGITASGLAALGLSWTGGTSQTGWIIFGVAAFLLTAAIWHVFAPVPSRLAAMPTQSETSAKRWTMEEAMMTLAYGLAGFGYIVTATFLPVIARQAMPGSIWVDLFWPVVGIFVAVGALLTRFVPLSIDRRTLLVILHVTQGLGVLLPLLLPNFVGFVLGSVLVGLPFTTIALFVMHEARRLRANGPTVFIALLTSSFGIGQIVGPLFVAWVLGNSETHAAGFSFSLEVAAGSLFFGAVLYLLSKKIYPLTAL